MMLPYSPFINQYWSVIVGGTLCLVAAKFIYQITMSFGNFTKYTDSISNGKLKGQYETDEQTPDQTADLERIEEEDDEYSDKPMFKSALPEDLPHVPFEFTRMPIEESVDRSKDFYQFMNSRRTVRHFSSDPISPEIIQNIIRTAGTAPSGAHTEPWTYVAVSDPDMKQRIREIVEEEEHINYKRRMGEKWTTDLRPLRTNWVKDYLTEAPYLILVFKQMYSFNDDGTKKVHYYNEASVSIAAGFLLAAIHYSGLVSLTSTPLNCGPALRVLLGRPNNEKLTLLLPIGYPAPSALVPDIHRKPLQDILIEI